MNDILFQYGPMGPWAHRAQGGLGLFSIHSKSFYSARSNPNKLNPKCNDSKTAAYTKHRKMKVGLHRVLWDTAGPYTALGALGEYSSLADMYRLISKGKYDAKPTRNSSL